MGLLRFPPKVTEGGAIDVPSATSNNEGLMSALQAQQLATLVSGGGGGGGAFNVVHKIAAYVAQYQDFVAANPTGGSFVVTLPAAAAASGAKNSIIVKVQSSSGNNVTVTPAGGDTIDGIAGPQTMFGRESLYLVSDGVSDWMVVA
jgi:hypothetical protein